MIKYNRCQCGKRKNRNMILCRWCFRTFIKALQRGVRHG